MKDIFDYIDAHLDDTVAELVRLCRQPSISAQGQGLEEMARLVAAMLQERHIRARILPSPGGGCPVVYGELQGDSPRTLLFYNHYDVQPPEPLELWTSPPFQPRVEGGAIWGRGVADNKGNIVARLAAIRAFQEVRGRLPASVKFCIEGEEEVGSPGLPRFVEMHRHLLRAEGCIWEGGGVNWRGQPQVILGCKGILYVELEVRSAARDVHSSLATVVPNAAWRLVWALTSLKDSRENILIPGFYDDVLPPSPQEMEAVDALPRDEEELRQSLGLKGFLQGAAGRDFLIRHLYQPTCTICGLVSGYTGEGSKTVSPALARAKVDFRLVPKQRPEDIMEKLRKHLERQGFEDIGLSTPMEGERPARTPLDSPFARLVAQAAQDAYGVEPVLVPTMAATGPMFCFTDTLGQPVAASGVEHPDSRAHAPDENIRLEDLARGIKHVAAILERFAEEGEPG